MVFTRAAEGGGEGVRWDTAKVVAVDDFFGEKERAELLALITQEGWDHTKGPPQGKWQKVMRLQHNSPIALETGWLFLL